MKLIYSINISIFIIHNNNNNNNFLLLNKILIIKMISFLYNNKIFYFNFINN